MAVDIINCGFSFGASIDRSSSSKVDYCHRYKQVILEIKEIGVENIFECNGDLSLIKLLVIDNRDEKHYLVLSLPDDYPLVSPTVHDIDLPDVVISQIVQVK